MKSFIKSFAFLGVMVGLLGYLNVSAQALPAGRLPAQQQQQAQQKGIVQCGNNPSDMCTFEDAIILANTVVKWLIKIGVIVAGLMIAYAGFLYMTANGETGKISQAHGIFLGVVIGIVVMLTAWLLVQLVLNVFGVEDQSLRQTFELK